MSLIVLASAKGSPGVSTTALALAAVWRADRQVLLVEADPAGSALAPRFGLGYDQGVASLAPACRHHFLVEDITGHGQDLTVGAGRAGIEVLVGVRAAEQARVLGRFWDGFGAAMAAQADTDVIVDCGRLWPDSPTLGLLRDASMNLLVVRPDTEGVVAAQLRATALIEGGVDAAQLGVIAVGDQPYGPGAVAEALDVPVLAAVARDGRAAAILGGQRPRRRLRLSRSALLRSARALADELESRSPRPLPPPWVPPGPDPAALVSGAIMQEADPGG
jgi:MinD-like ATPase involved in chromosome partitioning or flagellar assembly